MEINITDNIEEVMKAMTDIERQQVPFAASVMINNTMFDVRRRIIGSTYPKAFEVRNKAFIGRLLRIKRSNKRQLVAELFDSLGREYLQRHTTGGTKVPTGAGHVAVPIGRPPRGAGGAIPKSKRPTALRNKKSTFLRRGKSGNTLIVERFKGQTFARFVLVNSAKIDKAFRFYEDGIQTIEAVVPGHWDEALRRAIATSRVFSAA